MIDDLRLKSNNALICRLRFFQLLLLTPETVKELLAAVIRQHLGWLVVWGNVFGGLIGLVVLLSGLKLGHWEESTCDLHV